MKSDAVDAKILQALMNDGRASLRQIAQRTSLTTPTVSARLARMLKSGLIKKFVPVLSTDPADREVAAIVTLKVDSASAQKVADELARLQEVEAIYMTTGQGITLKVSLDSAQGLQPFLTENVLGMKRRRREVQVTSSQIITNTVKEEPPSVIPSMLVMNLKCDYCAGPVTSSRPYTLTSGSSRYYFCCKTCRKAYLDKHGQRLEKISRKLGAEKA